MKITIFTSNDLRHINLINKLAKISTKCFAIVEGKTLFPGKVDDFFKKTKLMKKYFANVKHAEKKIFSNFNHQFSFSNIHFDDFYSNNNGCICVWT